jgi:hypothetical protein
MELLVLIVVVMLVANFASLVLEFLRAGERDRRRVHDAQSIVPASYSSASRKRDRSTPPGVG